MKSDPDLDPKLLKVAAGSGCGIHHLGFPFLFLWQDLFVIGIEVGIEELADPGGAVAGETVEGAVHHLGPVGRGVAQRHVVGDAHRHVQEEGGDHSETTDAHLVQYNKIQIDRFYFNIFNDADILKNRFPSRNY